MSDTSPGRKLHKRGRKIIEDKKYYEEGERKINELKDLLDNSHKLGYSVKERQRIRNQLSAQKSRIFKKKQLNMLKGLIISN